MKRPSFQFYPADWRNNAKLRRCSEAARGAWMDVLCVLHDSDEYGVCRWPLSDLARAAGVPVKHLKELADKDVLKGGDTGCESYIYTPVSGRVHGESVVLVASVTGEPCWYCSRFVRDEYIRQRRGQNTRFDNDNQPANTSSKASSNNSPKLSPKPPFGERQGDGSTSTSTSTSSIKPSVIDTRSVTSTVSDPPISPGEVCKIIKSAGIANVSPSHPTLIALVKAGATLEEFANAAATCKQKGKAFSYLLAMVQGMREDAAKLVLVNGNIPKPDNWRKDDASIVAKAKSLRIGTEGLNRFQLIAKIEAKEAQAEGA